MRDITEGLSGQGVFCDMLCAVNDGDGPDEKDRGKAHRLNGTLILKINDFGKIICVRALKKVAGTMLSPAMIRFLRLHASEYDIIHIHHPDPMAALALYMSGYRGRVILHWHSDILSRKLLLMMYLPLQKWLISRAETIIVTTPVYMESSPYLRKVRHKCIPIPIGVDPVIPDAALSASVRRKYPAGRLILSIGRLVHYKGYEYLIEAFKYLPEDYHLMIVGAGPLRGRLESLISEYGLSGRITLEGYIEDEDLPGYYGACDLFVMSSIIRTEAFGIVQIEAMSCGIPVISTDIPKSGVSWVNKSGESGLTVPVRDPAAIARAILDIFDEDSYQRHSQGARMRYETVFTKRRMLDSILKVYNYDHSS